MCISKDRTAFAGLDISLKLKSRGLYRSALIFLVLTLSLHADVCRSGVFD